MKDRQPGYYWVKFKGTWVISEYTGYYWELTGREDGYYDDAFSEIIEEPIKIQDSLE